MAQDSKPKKYEDLLMAALQFDESDLTANMAGEWSERQSAQLRRRLRDHTLWAILLGALLLGALVFVPSALIERVSSSVKPVVSCLALVSFIAGLMAMAVGRSRLARDLRSGVNTVEGRVRLDTGPRDDKSTYFVKVNDVKFKVGKNEFLTFKNHDPYRLYYAPGQKKILSAEWLRGDSGSMDENESPQAAWLRTSELELSADEADDGDEILGDVVLGDDSELSERKAKPGR